MPKTNPNALSPLAIAQWVEEIQGQIAKLRMAIEEGKRLKGVNDSLHAAFKTLQVGSMPTPPSAPVPKEASTTQTPGSSLTPRLKSALHKGVDRARLAERGLVVADDGSIQTDSGESLFPPAFVTAIEAALGRFP